MLLDLSIKPWYHPVSLAFPHNCRISKKLTRNGGRDGYYLSDLLVIVTYQRDDRTGAVLSNPQFTVQQDGNHHGGRLLMIGPGNQNPISPNCWEFDQQFQMIFNEGLVRKQNLTVGGEVGAEKGLKGGLTLGAEQGEDRPASLYTINFIVRGALANISQLLHAEVRIL